jgi:hypothetical protein
VLLNIHEVIFLLPSNGYTNTKRLVFSLSYYFLAKMKNVMPDKNVLTDFTKLPDSDLNKSFIDSIGKIDKYMIDPGGKTIKGYYASLIVNMDCEFNFVHFCIAVANYLLVTSELITFEREELEINLIKILCLIDVVKVGNWVPFVTLDLHVGRIRGSHRAHRVEYPQEIIESGFVNFPAQIKFLIAETIRTIWPTRSQIEEIINQNMMIMEVLGDSTQQIRLRQKEAQEKMQEVQNKKSEKFRYLGTGIFVVAFLGSSFAVLGENISCIFSNCHFPILNYGACLAWNILFGIISAGSFVIAAIRILSTDKFQLKLRCSDKLYMKFLSSIFVGHTDLREEDEKLLIMLSDNFSKCIK